MTTDTVKVLNTTANALFTIGDGYMLAAGDCVAAFFCDVKGQANRAYPIMSFSASAAGAAFGAPCIVFESDDGQLGLTQEICFPEYVGWSVHCVRGGKTIAVCLTKDVR